jgi:hypothetical protein
VVSGHLLPEIHDLVGWRGMVEEGHPNIPHRLLGPAAFEQAREEFLLGAGGVSPGAARLAAPRPLEQRDQEVTLADKLADCLLRPPSSPSHALPPNNFVGSVGLAPASSAMFIDAGANNLTLIGEVARRGQKDAERQRVNHRP